MHRLSLPFVTAIFIAVVVTGCKENTLINSDVSPTDNVLGVFDTTLPVITHTYYDDTAITSYYVSGLSLYQGVGSLSDPYFGTMTGATHFEVLPVVANADVYNDMTLDSAVLILPYSGFTYGDTSDQNATQSYQAFFLDESIASNSIYYSYTTRSIDIGAPLSEPTTINLYHLKDSQTVNNVNYHPGLRLKLNLETLKKRLMPALTSASGSSDANSAFKSIFKGVSVRVSDSRTTTTAYPFFRLDGTDDYSGAGILVYYHPNGTTPDTALSERYFFDGADCGFFGSVTKSYGHSPLNKLLNSAAENDSVIALQNQPGPGLDILIPGITSLPEGLIVKAELQLTVLPNHKDDRFAPITRMYPLRISNGKYPEGTLAGSSYQVEDRYPITSSSAFDIMDCRLHDITRDGVAVESYIMRLPREVMSSITSKNDTIHLRVNGTQDFVGAFRTVLGGGNHPDPTYRAKLFVVYSSLKK